MEYFNLQGLFGIFPPYLLVSLMAWSIAWKGWALWIAARNKESVPWFVALLILNTAGILDILYIFVFSKMENRLEKKS
jgi:hypothetical protein